MFEAPFQLKVRLIAENTTPDETSFRHPFDDELGMPSSTEMRAIGDSSKNVAFSSTVSINYQIMFDNLEM